MCVLAIAALLMTAKAQAAEVKVMISSGFYGVYAELRRKFEAATGHKLITTRGPSMGDSSEAIPTRLARGEAADVVIMDGHKADDLAKAGLVREDMKQHLSQSLIAMVVKEGAAKPDISTAAAEPNSTNVRSKTSSSCRSARRTNRLSAELTGVMRGQPLLKVRKLNCVKHIVST